MSATENDSVKAEPAAATAAPPVAVVVPTTTQEATAASSAAEAAVTVAVVEVPPSTPIGETPAAIGRVSLLNEVDGQGKRRFFPRVKHLIGNKEWEEFLTQVLQCIEEAGAPETAAASHKANNSWYKAFDLIYGGVAREYSIPTGKNRYHKFKDKILEVWVALESQAPGENDCRDLAMVQYERYKRACSEANKNVSHSGSSLLVNNSVGSHKASKLGPGSTPGSAAYKLAGGKRSYNTAMGGGASLPFGSPTGLWKNLDEKAVLEGLPANLRSLVHLKQLSKEMVASTANRAARRGIEEHSKKLDGAYLEALTEYLKESSEGEGKKAKEHGEIGESEAVKKEDSTSAPDVEMTDDSGTAAEAETSTEASPPESAKAAYNRCLAVAFLYRYASTLHEQRVLAEAYARYTGKCVTFVKEAAPQGETTNGEEVAQAAAADEATEAAAVAMEDTTFEI